MEIEKILNNFPLQPVNRSEMHSGPVFLKFAQARSMLCSSILRRCPECESGIFLFIPFTAEQRRVNNYNISIYLWKLTTSSGFKNPN